MKVIDFIGEIKRELKDYDTVGLLDDISMFRWVVRAMSDFGQNIQELNETIVNVRDGKAILPDNYSSFHYACVCYLEQMGEEEITINSNSYQWVERDERIIGYNNCSPCCINKEDKVITEKREYRGTIQESRYLPAHELKLGKSIRRNTCSQGCDYVNDMGGNTIRVREKTLYAPFKEGKIYMLYYGTPIDEEGDFVIPDIGNSALEEFLEYHLKSKIFERLIANNDAKNLISLFQYYTSEAKLKKSVAYGVTKFLKLRPESFKRLAKLNKDILKTYSPKINRR